MLIFRKSKPSAYPLLHRLTHHHTQPPLPSETDRLAKLINDHPFPSSPLHPLLLRHLHPPLLSPSLLDSLLTRLFAAHANGLKALELFRFSLPHFKPTPRSFNATLHILLRMREFDKGWDLIREVRRVDPSLLTPKSLGIVLTRYVKFKSFEETLEAFDRMEKEVFVERKFCVDEFNVLIRAFCVEKKMMEARAVFRKLHSQFSPDTRTLNILLLGFKETRHVMALDLFYNEAVLRGFKPDAVSYNIRIDAYCKKGRLYSAMELLKEMSEKNLTPTIETITTMIQGAGIVHDHVVARRLFDEILDRNLVPDIGAYNALMSAVVRCKDVKSGWELMDEMEVNGVGHDDVTYYTMFLGLQKYGILEDVYKLYRRMVENSFLPKARTVVMLMKFFCESRRSDLGLDLWRYMVGKGCCPHGHALDLLVTGLCCKGQVMDAYLCFTQVVEIGRNPLERGFRVLEGFLLRNGEEKKLQELNRMLKCLQAVVPPSKGHALYSVDSTASSC